MLLADLLGLIVFLTHSYSDRKSEFSHSEMKLLLTVLTAEMSFFSLSVKILVSRVGWSQNINGKRWGRALLSSQEHFSSQSKRGRVGPGGRGYFCTFTQNKQLH